MADRGGFVAVEERLAALRPAGDPRERLARLWWRPNGGQPPDGGRVRRYATSAARSSAVIPA
jgi:hypothetical protein